MSELPSPPNSTTSASTPTAEQRSDGVGLIRRCRELGWVLTPVAPGAKAPVIKGWQSAPEPTEEQLDEWFGTGRFNPGLRLGSISGNLHDLDCDDERLVPFLHALAPRWVESCPRWTRDARPHVLVRTEAALPYRGFKLGGAMLLEIRGDGHQSLIPPAMHPSGTPYTWVSGPHNPDPVHEDELLGWAENSVIAFALSLGWSRGSRHDVGLAAAGWLARRGIAEERATAIVRAAARCSGDDEIRNREVGVETTYERVRREETAVGFPTLQQLLPPDAVKLLRMVFPRQEGDDAERVGRFLAREGRVLLVRGGGEGEPSYTELANFDARIVREVRRDDGSGEIRSQLELRGARASGSELALARVPADGFASMSWVIGSFGAGAIVSSGQGNREKLREAIQRLSGEVPVTNVFTHTGWREIEGVWRYLHAGIEDDVAVELDGSLSRYRLPRVPAEVKEPVRISLSLLDLGPPEVMVPLWCATFLAPLASILKVDLSVWLWAGTGSFKSTLQALFLCHFGEFDRLTLPADWASTDNALERKAFLAKDVVLVVDEFAPAASRTEHQRLLAKVSRILRAQGNGSGRERMRPDTTLRPAMPPRGIIFTSGESPPPLPTSAVARTLVLELEGSSVDLARLSQAQAQAPQLSGAMAAFIAWMQPRYDELRGTLPELFRRIRADVVVAGHRRTPEMLANLEVAAALAMQCFVEIGAIGAEEARAVMVRVKTALSRVGAAQDREVQKVTPARRFVDLLAELFAKKEVYCAGRHGETGAAPEDCEMVGWVGAEVPDKEAGTDVVFRPAARAAKLGWADEDFLYLLPEETWRRMVRFLGDTDQTLAASKDALARALEEAGLLEVRLTSGGVRRTAAVLVEGHQQRVWKVRREALEGGLE